MSHSDDTQKSSKSSAHTRSYNEANVFMGLSFGLARTPTRNEYVSIAKHISVLLTGSAIFKSQTLHDLLSPDFSNIAKFIGFSLIVLTAILLYKMLEKNGLLKEQYKRVDDNTHDE